MRLMSGDVAHFRNIAPGALELQAVFDGDGMEDAANASTALQTVIVAAPHRGNSIDQNHADDDKEHGEDQDSERHGSSLTVVVLDRR